MKLAISNIAWERSMDEQVYKWMLEKGFTGLEIAPTRWLDTKTPYEPEERKEAAKEAEKLRGRGISIVSMQSLWYGKQGRIAESSECYQDLLDYTKKAIDYAAAVQCPNLVFGNPTARTVKEEGDIQILTEFFKEASEYAKASGTVLAIEANPVIYHTNFLNTTKESIQFAKNMSEGCKVNLDIGTVIYNQEDLDELIPDMDMIHHVHISEPGLATIKLREIHRELAGILKKTSYEHYVSIEMKNANSSELLFQVLDYVSECFL